MRALKVAAVVLVVLVGGALVAADLLLTGLVNRQQTRSQIHQLAADALNRDVASERFEISLFPPSVVVVAPSVAGETPDAARFVQAERVVLEVALLPLLARAVVIRSLRVEGATLQLVLTPAGMLLPEVRAAESEAEPDAAEASGGFALAVQEVELVDARLHFEDRKFSPPFHWELAHVDLRARGESLEEPFQLEIEIEAAGGGRVAGGGTSTLDGVVELDFRLEDFPLQPVEPYLAAASEIAGALTGELSIRGALAAPDPISLNVELRDGRIRFEQAWVEGRMQLKAEMRGGTGGGEGSFEIDATAATLQFQEVFQKDPGRPATLRGRLQFEPGGRIAVDDVELRIGTVEGRGSLEIGERTRVALSTEPVELSGFQPLLVALTPSRMSGAAQLRSFELVTNPTTLRGEGRLEGVQVTLPGGGEFALRGALLGEGDRIRSRDLVLEAGGQVLPLEVEVSDLDGAWSYRLSTRAKQADARQLVAALSPDSDALQGALDLSLEANGDLAGEVSFVQGLRGRARVDIAPGKLSGTSILEATFREFDKMRRTDLFASVKVPVLGQPVAPRLQRFYRDDFTSLGATLEVEGGVARTPDFRLVTRSYDFELAGLIELDTLGLDARGQLVLGRELTAAVAGQLGLQKLPLLDRVVIPLPTIGGTLTDPKPRPDFSVLVRTITGNLPVIRQMKGLLRTR